MEPNMAWSAACFLASSHSESHSHPTSKNIVSYSSTYQKTNQMFLSRLIMYITKVSFPHYKCVLNCVFDADKRSPNRENKHERTHKTGARKPAQPSGLQTNGRTSREQVQTCRQTNANEHERAQTRARTSTDEHKWMHKQAGNHRAGTNEQQDKREQAGSGGPAVYWYVFYILLAHAHILTSFLCTHTTKMAMQYSSLKPPPRLPPT